MLSVRDLTVRYGRTPAIQNVSLDVGEGEIVGLVGPNGAGKSTTLAAIFGLVPVAEGEITYDGASLVGLATEKIVRRGLALVLERRHIFNTLTVRENLLLGTTANRHRVRSDAALEPVLDRFPVLRRTFRSPAGNLSGGEQQQLAIARALLAEPRLLVLDEPSLGLAPLLVDQRVRAPRRASGEPVSPCCSSSRTSRARSSSRIARTSSGQGGSRGRAGEPSSLRRAGSTPRTSASRSARWCASARSPWSS